MKFTKLTEEILEKAGWYEGRDVDISEYLLRYKKNNIKINDKIEAFLKEFSGLKIVYPNYRLDDRDDDLEISNQYILYFEKETQEYYEERTGEYLVPIGAMCKRYLEVYM